MCFVIAHNSAKNTSDEAHTSDSAAPVKPEQKATTPTAKLKNYATSNKKPSPVFKDLGSSGKGQNAEYKVECSFMNETTLGVGKSRIEARESASRLMTDKIGIGKKKKAGNTSANQKVSNTSAKTKQNSQSDKAPQNAHKKAAAKKHTQKKKSATKK